MSSTKKACMSLGRVFFFFETDIIWLVMVEFISLMNEPQFTKFYSSRKDDCLLSMTTNKVCSNRKF
jgi:hypothetical protein